MEFRHSTELQSIYIFIGRHLGRSCTLLQSEQITSITNHTHRVVCNMYSNYILHSSLQVCKLKLGTWAYDGWQVNLTKLKDAIDTTNYQRNGEWRLMKTETVRNVEQYTCCPAPFIDVTFTLYLQRR